MRTLSTGMYLYVHTSADHMFSILKVFTKLLSLISHTLNSQLSNSGQNQPQAKRHYELYGLFYILVVVCL